MYNMNTKSLKTKQNMADSISDTGQKVNALPNSSLSISTVTQDYSSGKLKGKAEGKKQKAVYPCCICLNDSASGAVCCDQCDTWYQDLCIGMSAQDFDALPNKWYGHKCKKS